MKTRVTVPRIPTPRIPLTPCRPLTPAMMRTRYHERRGPGAARSDPVPQPLRAAGPDGEAVTDWIARMRFGGRREWYSCA